MQMNLIKKYCLYLIAIVFVLGSFFVLPVPTLAQVLTPEWGYEGAINPTKWGKIDRDFATCELGGDQSPIDITGTVTGQPIQIAFNYQSSPMTVVNNGYNILVNYAPGNTISIDGAEYTLLQFHFHTPSEHQIGGKAAAMELHFVHRNQAGKLAVVGVMMNEGKQNPVIDQIWQAIPPTGKTTTLNNSKIDIINLLPLNKSVYTYAGSLTTPPCSEGVNWNVLAAPITVSTAQIHEFEKFYPINARPLQPIHNRRIELHKTVQLSASMR
jgi:carbonic anhydrase